MINRNCSVQQDMAPHNNSAYLQAAIKNLDSLPAMPIIAQKLLALKLDTDEGERQMQLLIVQDSVISAKIIGLANTPLLGTSKKVTSVKDATLLLGLSRVRSVVMGIAIMSLMKKPAGRFNVQDLWLHNLGIAFGMLAITRAMPAKIRPQEDQAFLAGMLHDIGYLALAYLDSARSDALHDRLAGEPDRPALDIEREMLGVTHDELGAELARSWHLPEEIVVALRYHHKLGLSIDSPEDSPGQTMARIINLTEKLLPSFGLHEYIDQSITVNEWQILGIGVEKTGDISSQVTEQAEQALQFINHFV